MASTLPKLPIFEAIASHDPHSTAVIHSLSGRRFQYGELLGDVRRTRDELQAAAGKPVLDGERIAFLVENSYDYVVTLLAALATRSIAVPLSPAFPAAELQYILNQSEASLLVSSPKFFAKARDVLATELASKPAQLELQKHMGGAAHEAVQLEGSDPGDAGMMLYTSGTTNRPSVLTAQSKSLIEAWEYTPLDHLLHVLPLHHIHGTINALLTPLFAGSTIEFLFPFNPDAVWNRLAAPFTNASTSPAKEKVTFFTVVPTVYSRLLSSHKSLPEAFVEPTREAVSPQNMRLAISGSAALPTPVKEAWRRLFARQTSYSSARLVDTDTGAVIPRGDRVDAEGANAPAKSQLRGPTIFKEYWRNPTRHPPKEFATDPDGRGPWFKTGDVAVRRAVEGAGGGAADQPWAKGDMYFIQGRQSADIIKTGGEKVSALEVERELLTLDVVAEAAVVAVPSGKWGQKVGAVVILDNEALPEGKTWSPMDMRRALRGRLANYKIPQVLKVVDHIPRNAMGKINKKELVKEVFADQFSDDEV
ncbi:conserved hypothetical protein [Verticillium alfalfae VaMs.102]|uniref:2-succinylbenzoate-CoA ligase n=1 Tax=Verticillium alfalfae (strain VaMs.102 / ATCC MYA-4576 / FGSC 10136) TaxID=526221 RepID=C9SEX5_VERA1|nr:conserved hypothetical protein [Verticillium alfalfae VaMs.102]EEY17761.1 conserved hypothetical protein [Verticillium alfalfae VaMs.102]